MNLRFLPVPRPTVRPARRSPRRAMFAMAAAVAAVALPAGVASAADVGFWMYDADQDGDVDDSTVDMFGSDGTAGSDGYLDANLLDISGNRLGDTWLLDMNQNSVVDHIGFDRAEDGYVEEWHVDVDEDGVIEGVYADQDGDGLPETMQLTGPANSTADIDWERDVCPQDPFWCMQWPAGSANGAFTIPVDGVSVAAGLENLDSAASLMSGL